MNRAFGGMLTFPPLSFLLQFFHPNDPNPLEYNNKVVGEYSVYNIYKHNVRKIAITYY